jgi:hypothetical protein
MQSDHATWTIARVSTSTSAARAQAPCHYLPRRTSAEQTREPTQDETQQHRQDKSTRAFTVTNAARPPTQQKPEHYEPDKAARPPEQHEHPCIKRHNTRLMGAVQQKPLRTFVQRELLLYSVKLALI